MPRTLRRAPRTLRRYMGRLFRTGAGWTMIAIAFAAFVAAVAIIIYEVEVYLPEHQGVDQRAPAIIHQTHPPLEVPN